MNGKGIIRKHMKIYGRVQGVGFRYSACYSASQLGLTGWVRNEWDGTVEMEVQGTEKLIQKLMAMLDGGRFIRIEEIEETEIPLVEDERAFKARG
ncbi:MAG TPA: acylphosphatase [Lachnospiraceae bacterium]|nr:acylphosphatase [Lachnospiraceae bacterium]